MFLTIYHIFGLFERIIMKIKFKNVNIIYLHNWDEFVEDTYKRPYSFQQQNGCQDRGTFPLTVPYEAEDFKNDTVPEIVNGKEMGVSFKAWLERDPKKPLENQKYDFELQLWWERNFYPNIQMIANDLHSKGLLDTGDYLIDIDW